MRAYLIAETGCFLTGFQQSSRSPSAPNSLHDSASSAAADIRDPISGRLSYSTRMQSGSRGNDYHNASSSSLLGFDSLIRCWQSDMNAGRFCGGSYGHLHSLRVGCQRKILGSASGVDVELRDPTPFTPTPFTLRQEKPKPGLSPHHSEQTRMARD